MSISSSRVSLAQWLRAVAAWLDPAGGSVLVVPHDPLYFAACVLVAGIDNRQESAEWKRHQVYAALLKEFKDASARDIALAIEAAVRS